MQLELSLVPWAWVSGSRLTRIHRTTDTQETLSECILLLLVRSDSPGAFSNFQENDIKSDAKILMVV